MLKDIYQKWVEEGRMTEMEAEYHRVVDRLYDFAFYEICTNDEEAELYNNYIVLEMLLLVEGRVYPFLPECII